MSKKDVSKATLGMTLQHPATLYTTAAGLLGFMAGALLNPSLYLFGAALGGVTLGTGSWIVNYFFRNDAFARKYLQKVHAEMTERKKKVLERLRRTLSELQDLEGAEELARQGFEQFTRVQEKFESFQTLLSSKLNESELTYARYYGTAEQVVLSVLDNLQDIVTLLESSKTIKLDYIRERMAKLGSLPARTEADEQELETLTKRLQVRRDQLEKVNVLLTKNEEAMTSLDQTTAAIAEMKTVRGRAMVDMETAREELEDLARRAERYSLT